MCTAIVYPYFIHVQCRYNRDLRGLHDTKYRKGGMVFDFICDLFSSRNGSSLNANILSHGSSVCLLFYLYVWLIMEHLYIT